jgi:hypothetical protein
MKVGGVCIQDCKSTIKGIFFANILLFSDMPKEKGGLPEDIFFSCDIRYPFVATTYRVTEYSSRYFITCLSP